MSFDYSATNLIAAIRDISYAGSSDRDWGDTKLLRLLNREINAYLVPLIVASRKEHFDTYADQALVANQAAYRIPSNAMGGKIRAAQLVTSTGAAYSGLVELPLEDAINFGVSGTSTTGVPSGYFFRGNQLVLYPVPASAPSLSLRIYYAARPATLVLPSACVLSTDVSNVPGVGTGFRMSFAGGVIPTGYGNDTSVDIVQAHGGFDVLASTFVANATTSYLQFSSPTSMPDGLAAGDYVCQPGTAPVVTGAIPEMVMGCLVKKCALEVMASKGDDGAFSRISKLLALDEKRAITFLRKRNEGDHAKVGKGSLGRFRRGGSGW